MRKTPPPTLVLPFPPYAEPRGREGAKKCRVTRGERGRGMRSGSQGSKPNYRAVEQSKGGGKRTRNNKRQKKLVPLVLATVHPLLNMILLLSPFFLPFHFLPSLPPFLGQRKREKALVGCGRTEEDGTQTAARVPHVKIRKWTGKRKRGESRGLSVSASRTTTKQATLVTSGEREGGGKGDVVKFTMSSINEQQNPRGGGGGVEREKEGRKGKLFSCCREGEVKKVAAFLALSPRREAQTFLSDIQQIQAGGGGNSSSFRRR